VAAAQAALGSGQLEAAAAQVAAAQAALAPGQLEVAAAQVAAAQAALDLLKVEMGKLTVLAPSDGVILSRAVEVGEVANAGATLMVIGPLERVQVTVYVPEDRYGQITLGQAAELRVDSFPGRRSAPRWSRSPPRRSSPRATPRQWKGARIRSLRSSWPSPTPTRPSSPACPLMSLSGNDKDEG
jgi:multidrug efflux pump subunit AcrA (membrane-fusion protein)